MAVGIYLAALSGSLMSQDGNYTKPFAITFDGRIGGFKETKLYIRNDDPTYYYTNLELAFQDLSDENIVTNQGEGFSWKLIEGNSKPTLNDWKNTPAGNTLSFASGLGSLGSPDIATYLPFWIFIEVPPGLDIQVFRDVKFLLSGNEVLV